MGKRTTTRHKEDNTFRFQTFEEKLRQISVNVNLSIRDGRGENPDGNETFFSQEIEKWVDLNRTETFADLLCKIGTDLKSLTQILLQKDKLVTALLEHLDNEDNVASFEPAFGLVVALSRDLEEEFYPYFQNFFKIIVKVVMKSKTTNIIESGFKCYAYLSKYLRRQIIRDLRTHLKQFACFLDPKLKAYVMIFACEAFSIVSGKYARDHPQQFLKLLFEVFLRNNPEHAVGVATLLFAIFKSVGGTLKINGPGLQLKSCFSFVHELEDCDQDVWTQVNCHVALRLLGHANPSNSEALIHLIEDIVLEDLRAQRNIKSILTIYSRIVGFNNAGKLQDIPSCAKLLRTVSSTPSVCQSNCDLLTEMVMTIVESKCLTAELEILSLLQPVIVDLLQVGSYDTVETIDRCVRSFRPYFRMFIESVIEAYSRNDKPKYLEECSNIPVYCLSEAILQQGGLYQLPNSDTHYFTGNTAPMYYYGGQKRIVMVLNASSIKGTNWNCCSLFRQLQNEIKEKGLLSRVNYCVRLLLVFSRLNSRNCESCLFNSISVLSKLIQPETCCNSSRESNVLPAIYYVVQLLTAQTAENATYYELVPLEKILNYLMELVDGAVSKSSFSLWGLKILDSLVHFCKVSNYEPFEEKLKDFILLKWDLIASNLQSGFRIVRALSLSILRGTIHLTQNNDGKHVEMLEKFLELEDMSLTNSRYSSLAKSVLTECKVIMESDNYQTNIKIFCLKYTLGLLYTNYNLLWTPCIEVIRQAGKSIEMGTFWETFGFHLCKNQNFPTKADECLRTSILPAVDEQCSDFFNLLLVDTFGLPKSESCYTGAEEQLDITQYKSHLWQALKGLPLTKKEFADLKGFVDEIIGHQFTEPASVHNDNHLSRDNNRETYKLIVPVLQFLETSDLVNVNHELWEIALKFLMYPQDIQKSAWKFLFAKRKNKLKNYKDDIEEVLNSDSMDPIHKFRLDAVDTSMKKQYENETTEKRALLMEILLRILIGKERVMKGDKRLQVLRFLAGCSESDAKKYMDLTVGSLEDVKNLSPKSIEMKINKMTSALRIWRYKFPQILDKIINSVCGLTNSIDISVKPVSRKSFNAGEQIPDQVFEEQKKSALRAGRLCIVAFFSSLPRLDMKEETLDRIFNVFIWPALEDISTTSVGSVSWILKLFLVWSTYERYHILFTKCKNADVNESPMWKLFDLLDSKSTVFEVKKYILGIILNLTNPPEISDNTEEPNKEYLLLSSNSELRISGTFNFETSETTGVNIVLLRREVILQLFQDSQTLKKFTTNSGGEGCLALISLLAGFSSGGESNDKLCSVIIDTFRMCKNNEESLANSIAAVGKLLINSHNPEELLLKFGQTFSWVSGRRLRAALVEALRCKHGTMLFEVISGINAWTESAEDIPDFITRQKSFEIAEKQLREETFDMLTYAMIFNNCMYNICYETDSGLRNSAKNFLQAIAARLPEKANKNEEVIPVIHKFLDTIVLPKLRICIHEKDDKRFEDILCILFAFVNSSSDLHGTFNELQKIISLDIVEGLCNIQVHLRTRAMNRLEKKLGEAANEISPAPVQAFILPIATHNLFDEARLSKNFNELIDSSIEVLKKVMSTISHDQYFSYLNKLLDDPKKSSKLSKQFERILIAIMDAFHFDMSLASSVEKNESVNNHIKSEAATTEDQQQNENADDEEQEQGEEFRISEQTPGVPVTLLPHSAAVRCLGILKSQIIPKLRKFLNFEEKATHKLSKATKTVDDSVILKIPCTIALVKLLKKIPKAEGQNGIRSIIPSLTAGLRNELVSVRNTLRKTLLNVIKELGTSHLKVVIGYLKSSLLRGYQKHVLNYTVAYLLRCLENDLKANPTHVPVKEILPLCEVELYGTMQEEKEVQAIKQKTREASKSNASPILKVCAKCVSSAEQLDLLIDPAIKQITEKKSLKVAKSSRQWLLSVTEGLAENSVLNYHELLEWLLKVIQKDGIYCNDTGDRNKEIQDEPPSKKLKLLETPKDHKLIPVLKKKTVTEGRLGGPNLLMEFGFTCLYSGLNKGVHRNEALNDHGITSLLDTFIPILSDGIKASSKQVNVVSLRSLTLLMEFDLRNFKKPEIIEKLQRNGFTAMSNHCYRNTTDSEITNATFKFLSAFFVRFPEFKIVLQDFELMLKCIQGYLTDGNCSSSALTLLRGVLQNKYKCSTLPDLMQEVFKQCITSYYKHVNEGCREAYLTYLNNYLTNPKDLYVEVQLILRQLDYEHENGRLTAAEILHFLLQSIPEDCFEEIKELIFLKLLATLDKEKLPKVRERLGDAVKSLFKLERNKSLPRILLKLLVLEKHVPELDTFFLIIGQSIQDPKIFNNDEMTVILERMKDVLVPSSLESMCAQNSRITQQIKDYMIFQALVALKKSMTRNVFSMDLWNCSSPLRELTETIFGLLRDTYLLYEHEWVPLIAVDIISIVLNKLQLTDEGMKTEVANNLSEEMPVCAFLRNTKDLNQLCNKLWTAMRNSEREDVLAKGAYCLVILVSVGARLVDKEFFVNIINSLRQSVNEEVVKTPRISTVRTVVMGCFRGIAKTCPRDAIEQVAEIMTRVAVRELTDDNVSHELKSEAEKLVSVLRDVIGNSEFNLIHARVNDHFYKKRNLNKAKKKEKIMLHPGLVRKRSKKTKPNFQHGKKKKRTN